VQPGRRTQHRRTRHGQGCAGGRDLAESGRPAPGAPAAFDGERHQIEPGRRGLGRPDRL